MSDCVMSVSRARRLTDGGHHTVHAGLVVSAARTIVAQAEQIERVREARSMINRIITAAEGGVDLGDPATLAKSIVNKLNDALGDTDD